MPTKKKVIKPHSAQAQADPEPLKLESTQRSPLIFISHDHRDAALAEHFANLLTDASGGTLKSFRSSAKKSGAGLEFGSEWYSEIMSKIDDASDVVALLTVNSIDRPWILFEAGFAKAKLERPVFGVVVGVPIDQAVRGPFAQFQNSTDDDDSITKLVIQLIKRNPDAEPREQAVRNQVAVFREAINKEMQAVDQKPAKKSEKETADAAKLFEEVKVLFRETSERLDYQISRMRPHTEKYRVNENIIEAIINDAPDLITSLMILSSLFREDAPWVYEASMNLVKALETGLSSKIDAAFQRLRELAIMSERSKVIHYLTDRAGRGRTLHALFSFVNILEKKLMEHHHGVSRRVNRRSAESKNSV